MQKHDEIAEKITAHLKSLEKPADTAALDALRKWVAVNVTKTATETVTDAHLRLYLSKGGAEEMAQRVRGVGRSAAKEMRLWAEGKRKDFPRKIIRE